MICIPFFHAYGRWTDVARRGENAVLIQERRCAKCGKAQRRHTAWMGGSYDDLHDGDDSQP